MAEQEIMNIIRSCVSPAAICKIGFSYQQYEEFFFPLSVSEELFIAVSERDFRLDGFTIRRNSDIVSAEPIRGTYLKIHNAEGNIAKLSLPPINIKNWRSVFPTICASNENVIVEGFTPDLQSKFFIIGRALQSGEQGIRFRSFDGGGNWNERTLTIPYTNIFSLTFGSSYITTYTKYVRPYPEIKTQRPTNR